MANLNVFSCDAGTFSIDQAIQGQTPLVMYDSLKQAAYLPAIRQVRSGGSAQVIMPYDVRTPEALWSQMQAAFGSENRTVPAREFYWLEYDSYDTLTFVVDKVAGVPGAGGAPVIATIDTLSRSTSGNYTKPISGYYGWIKENNRQKVFITSVNKAADTVVLTPINGEVLDLTKYGRYTVIIDPLRHYTLGDTNPIQPEGLVLNPPTMYKAFAQKFEKRLQVNQDEIDNYIYDRDFKVIKGLNTAGQVVDFFYIPALNGQLEALITDNKNLNTLFGQRDYTNQKGFDGLIPTAEKYGMFNAGYDIFTNVSLKQILFGMIKTLRRVEGCNSYTLHHDFNFWMDWSESIGELIKASKQSYKYSLFGEGGTGARDFSYFSFSKFDAFGYEFIPYMIDAFDNRRYGNILEFFAVLTPNAKFKDQMQNTVPFLTYCFVEGAEPAMMDNIFIYDFRKQFGRTLDIGCVTTWGMEIHAPTRLGILKKTSTQ
jgi:hypothetical protein